MVRSVERARQGILKGSAGYNVIIPCAITLNSETMECVRMIKDKHGIVGVLGLGPFKLHCEEFPVCEPHR